MDIILYWIFTLSFMNWYVLHHLFFFLQNQPLFNGSFVEILEFTLPEADEDSLTLGKLDKHNRIIDECEWKNNKMSQFDIKQDSKQFFHKFIHIDSDEN